MKKYILFIISVFVIIGGIFIANSVMLTNNTNKKFANSGYILKYNGNAERYYFGNEAIYKKTYNDQVVFKNTDDDKVVVDLNNFIHYSDGSISSFKKGVLINLDNIETEPITYYNFSANKVLKKLSNKYVAKNLDNELEFTNLIWKISNSKYLLAADDLKIVFSDKTEKQITGYLEIEYVDNEVVRIYNQDVTYETISTDVYLKIAKDIKINLGTKIISKGKTNEMSLDSMVIDSNDNVSANIIDLEEYKEQDEDKESDKEKNKEENKDKTNNDKENTTIIQGGNNTSNSEINTPIIGGGEDGTIEGNEQNNIDNEQNNIGNGSIEVEVDTDELKYVSTPKYTVKQFEVSATGVKAIVEIQDNEARLVTGTKTSILNNSTGKTVYTLPETGEMEVRVDTECLEPNTEYTLIMEAAYLVDGVEYKKNFVYKVFRTSIFGVTLEKDLFTDDSLFFNLKFDDDSTVSKLDVELAETGQVIEQIDNKQGNTEKLIFEGLQPNTEYTINVKNVYIGNVSNDNIYSYKFKTLKTIPRLNNSNVQVETDKLNHQFVLSIPELEKLNGLETLNYQIYTETEGKEILVYNKITTDSKVVLKIGDTIKTNTNYYCKVYASFYDNEKVVEYEIANSETSFNMNSKKMPSVRFDKAGEEGITFNSAKGFVVIEDPEGVILENEKLEIYYSSTTENIDDSDILNFENVSRDGNEVKIPMNLDELKANETYKFTIYATYNLGDQSEGSSNGNRYGYIGTVLVNTKQIIPMIAKWEKDDEEGINIQLKLSSTENSDKEAKSLYSFDLALYLGQEGASKKPVAKTTIIDKGTDNFAASIKTEYCDFAGEITQQIFGLSDAEIAEIVNNNKYCTISLTNAKDYVSKNGSKKFDNIIPIEQSTYTYEISELFIKNPAVSQSSMKVQNVTKEKIQNVEYDQIVSTKDYTTIESILDEKKINDSTLVALNVSANMSGQLLNQYNYFEYFVYDENQNLIAQTGLIEKNIETNETPKVLFLISNGTGDDVVDEGYLARGNKYYFKYYAYEDNTKKVKYPTDLEDGSEYWKFDLMPSSATKKQKANAIMFPASSDITSFTYKYIITDIDNSIFKNSEGRSFFYNFYGNSAILSVDKPELILSNDTTEMQEVKFDLSEISDKGYNFEVRIIEKEEKSGQQTYTTLTTQKFVDIIEIFPETIITSDLVASSTITLNNLTYNQKQNIIKAKVELKDENDNIINIEKTKTQLESANWSIKINYLEDIIYNTNAELKGKKLTAKVYIYYINGQAGYDYAGDIAYQTVDDTWLSIVGTEFINTPINSQSKITPVMYNKITYDFTQEETTKSKVKILRDEEELSWLNYSPNGLTRNIEGKKNVPILPKKVALYENDNVGSIIFANVVPGIKSSNDLEIITNPTEISIKIDKLYTKDTIYDYGDSTINVYADIYKYEDDSFIKSALIGNDGVTITDLPRGLNGYFKLYIKDGENKFYLYDMDKKQTGVSYEFTTLDTVQINDMEIEFTKDSMENAELSIRHNASVTVGYKGFEYEFYDVYGNLITDEISYKTKGKLEATTDTGKFEVKLEEYGSLDSGFEVVLDASRGTFFEYNTVYKIKITPIIENDSGETEIIGETFTKNYKLNKVEPSVNIRAKRVVDTENNNQRIEWEMSVVDKYKLINGTNIEYEVLKKGQETPIVARTNANVLDDGYEKIVTNISSLDELKKEYVFKYYYSYYETNKDDTKIKQVQKEKKLSEVQNDVYIGENEDIECIIEENEIKLKFYNSYNLDQIKEITYTIYSEGSPMTETKKEINITDNETYKSINLQTNHTFVNEIGYIIQFAFKDESGNTITKYTSNVISRD